MTESKMKTLAQVVKQTGIGNSTLRKYLKDFSDLIHTEKGPRNTPMFDEEALSRIKLIRKGFQKRQSVDEIKAQLEARSGKKEAAEETPAEKFPQGIPVPQSQKRAEREDPPMLKGHSHQEPVEDPRLW